MRTCTECIDCIRAEAPSRLRLIVEAPIELTVRVTDTALGIILSTVDLITLRKFPVVAKHTQKFLHSTMTLLSSPYENLLLAVSPSDINMEDIPRNQITSSTPLEGSIKACFKSKNLFVRHLLGRFVVALDVVATTVSLIAHVVLGSIAMIFSLIARGKIRELNAITIDNLEDFGFLLSRLPVTIGMFFIPK